MVFDREGYSPELFEVMWRKRIAILTYHKFPKEDWRSEEFASHQVQLSNGETVTMKLAERGVQLSNKLWVREIRKLTDSGHQTSILTINFQAPMTTLAVSMFARMRFQILAPMVSGKLLSLYERTLELGPLDRLWNGAHS